MQSTPLATIPTVYLCINRLAPDFEGLELGIGESLLIKAIAEGLSSSTAKIKSDLVNLGDLGQVTQKHRHAQRTMFKPKPLTVQYVFSALKEIANYSGASVAFQFYKFAYLYFVESTKESIENQVAISSMYCSGWYRNQVFDSFFRRQTSYRSCTANSSRCCRTCCDSFASQK